MPGARTLLAAASLIAYTPVLFAQSSSVSYATPSLITATETPAALSTSTLSVISGGSEYAYIGCFNETTGYANGGNKRAITGGNMTSEDDMTPERCFDFYGDEQYAGLEYGRECWCGPYFSTLTSELSPGYCNISCSGLDNAACGGSLALTLFNSTRRSGSGHGEGQKGGATHTVPA
ncbi:uncharacterized protein K452DRAFT_314490, partial [Aplosporella prunicola CBS 121167]